MMEIAVFAGCACGTVAFLLFLQHVLLAVLKRVLDEERRKLADERRRFTAEVRALISLRTSQADVPCTVEARVALAEHDRDAGVTRHTGAARRRDIRQSPDHSSVATRADKTPKRALAPESAAEESYEREHSRGGSRYNARSLGAESAGSAQRASYGSSTYRPTALPLQTPLSSTSGPTARTKAQPRNAQPSIHISSGSRFYGEVVEADRAAKERNESRIPRAPEPLHRLRPLAASN